jgi:hypothetical protein
MGRRIVLPLTLLLALAWGGFACTVPLRDSPARLSVGREVPEFLRAEPGMVTLAWAFRADDMLSCGNAAMSLRHAVARYGKNIRLVAMPVGDDAGLAESFMRRQRLDPEIRRLELNQYRRALGSTQVPAIFVISDRFVRDVTTDSTWSDGVPRRVRSLETLLASVLEHRSSRGS